MFYNKVILVGNLTRDVEIRYLPSGLAVASTGLAVNRRFKDRDGNLQEETLFIDITIFGRTAEIANQYLKKGRRVLVEGRLRFEQWSDQLGNKRSKHSVVVESLQMMDTKSEENRVEGVEEVKDLSQPKKEVVVPEVEEDEIPF